MSTETMSSARLAKLADNADVRAAEAARVARALRIAQLRAELRERYPDAATLVVGANEFDPDHRGAEALLDEHGNTITTSFTANALGHLLEREADFKNPPFERQLGHPGFGGNDEIFYLDLRG
ncbi:hypothetical protein ACFVAJ_18725 [Agromyces sp. NPDC057679]|uniref:hypothetical protein n=1 Tax=Agromyces sp. NPDC057679 TaxID=3346207 RepID=UPI00366E75A1